MQSANPDRQKFQQGQRSCLVAAEQRRLGTSKPLRELRVLRQAKSSFVTAFLGLVDWLGRKIAPECLQREDVLVRRRGLEPLCLAAQAPQACASANFATSALRQPMKYSKWRELTEGIPIVGASRNCVQDGIAGGATTAISSVRRKVNPSDSYTRIAEILDE